MMVVGEAYDINPLLSSEKVFLVFLLTRKQTPEARTGNNNVEHNRKNQAVGSGSG